MPKENVGSDVFDFLKSRFELGESVDENGNATTVPEEMKVFSFDFKNNEGKDLGCVVCSILPDAESTNSLKVYFGSELYESDSESQKEWLKFLKDIRQFAKMHMLGFDVRNINKSTITKRDIEPMFESTFGPIDGTIRTSKQPLDNMQIIIKHTANVDPKIRNARSRKIQKIYLANSNGEKFLLPFKSLMAARAMARHIQSGGTPYDAVGSDICSLVEEMTSLSKFVRHLKNISNPEAINAINASKERVHDIKRQLSSLSSQGGYEKNKPSLTGNLGQLEEDEDMPNLFDNDSLDDESKMTLPHVMRAYRNKQKPTEEGEFESWADSIITGKPESGEEILNDEEELTGPRMADDDDEESEEGDTKFNNYVWDKDENLTEGDEPNEEYDSNEERRNFKCPACGCRNSTQNNRGDRVCYDCKKYSGSHYGEDQDIEESLNKSKKEYKFPFDNNPKDKFCHYDHTCQAKHGETTCVHCGKTGVPLNKDANGNVEKSLKEEKNAYCPICGELLERLAEAEPNEVYRHKNQKSIFNPSGRHINHIDTRLSEDVVFKSNDLTESEVWQDELSKWAKSSIADPKLEAIIKERLPEMYSKLDNLRHGRATDRMCKKEKARIEKALRAMSKLNEADEPCSAGDGSPLSHPNLKPMNDFHSRKEIEKLKNTSGSKSPLSLISGEDKELNEIKKLSGI